MHFLLFTENREDMLNPANNKLTDVLEEANKLFVNGIISIHSNVYNLDIIIYIYCIFNCNLSFLAILISN